MTASTEKSVRLSQSDKDIIVSKMKNGSKWAKKIQDNIVEKENKLAQEVVEFILGKDKDIYPKLMPANRDSINEVYVRSVVGMKSYQNLDLKLPGKIACPDRRVNFSDLNKTLQKKLEKYYQEREKVDEEIKKFGRELSAIISGANTTNQLIELLPETREHFPLSLESKMQATCNLPAIPAETLKKLRSKF